MDKKEKVKKINDDYVEKELLNDFLSFEYYDWRLQLLADKIKLENYRPRIRLYNF